MLDFRLIPLDRIIVFPAAESTQSSTIHYLVQCSWKTDSKYKYEQP